MSDNILNQGPTYKVKVNQTDGRLQTNAPLSLRNVVREGAQATVENIEDIQNVTVSNREDGSVIQYNSSTQNYEVKRIEIDGGTF